MQQALKKLIQCLFATLLVWNSCSIAGDVKYKLAEFYDASAAIQIEQISPLNFQPTTGQIRKPYEQGNLWIRITVDEKISDPFVYFENPSLDQVVLFSRKNVDGNAWKSYVLPMHSLLRGYQLPTPEKSADGLNEFYLKVHSESAKQFNLKLLSEAEVNSKENLRYAILSSQFTAAVILLIWVVIQNWLARSKIFITVMVSIPLFVLSRLNYFGFFLKDDSSNSIAYLNLNMVFFSSLICIGTLMVKESFGRLFTRRQNQYFLAIFGVSLLPAFGILINVPRGHLVASTLVINFVLVSTLFYLLAVIFIKQKSLLSSYKFQIAILAVYSTMSVVPGVYFIAPQIFPFAWGIPAFRDFFYPVLAFLIMMQMLNEQKEKEMDAIFNLAVTKANAESEIEKNKQQHVFLGMLLHEIKTPLSVIKFGADALKNSQADISKNQIWATRVDGAADNINQILNQCLLADKFEFGLSSYNEQQVNVRDELANVIDRVGYMNPTFRERIQWQLEGTLPSSTTFSVDPVYLRSILENLISNALKYSATNSHIHVLVGSSKNNVGSVFTFEIKNQIGKVGPPQIAKIFSRYYRAEEAKGYAGTGLGLWLANQQAKKMGAEIQCHFDDIWTTFTLVIPKLREIE